MLFRSKLIRPLHLDLLTGQQAEYAQKRLLQALDNYGWRLGTGFLSTPFILDVLTKMDVEYAYRLLENVLEQESFKVISYTFQDSVKVNIYEDLWIDFKEFEE